MQTCAQCSAQKDAPRTPRGWKQIGGRLLCDHCKSAAYALRAVSIPVAHCDWEAIRPLLRTATADVTSLANWLACQFYASDTRRMPGDEKLPKWAPPYLYPVAREAFPAIEPTALVSVINTVQGKYRAARLDLWRHKISLPTFRDLPVPLCGQAWRLSRGEDGRYVFEFRWLREWHPLTLRGGAEFRRQLEQLAQILSGDAEAGEAALYQRGRALMLKIAAWFPRKAASGNQVVVKARTCADGFLVATASTGAVWRLNGDHVSRWIGGFARQQQRLREDLKAERRFPGRMRAGIVDRMGEVSDRRRGRIDSWSHEASAQLVNWARRMHAWQLVWDDAYTSMLPEFPWFVFRQRIADKCAMAGIECVYASEGATEQPAQPLAEESKG